MGLRHIKKLSRFTSLDQKFVFLTHSHNDHTGFLGELLAKSGARLVTHESSLPRLASGVNVMPDGTGFTSRMGVADARDDEAFLPSACGAGRECNHPQKRGRSTVSSKRAFFADPHVSAGTHGGFDRTLLEETRELFAHAAGNAIIAPARQAVLMEDVRAFAASWDKIIALNLPASAPATETRFRSGI
ncbi:MAG: MBL fold metallo-hydrolase [Eubacteriales bacterium]